MNRMILDARLLLLAVMLSASLGCHSSSRAEPESAGSPGAVDPAADAPVIRVTAAKPARKTLRLVTVQPGQIQAFEQTPLHAKLAGYVRKVNVDIGDRVEANQPLAELWIPELEDEVRQKEALVAQAQAEINQAAAAVHVAEATVVTAQARIRETQAGTVRAEGTYQRWKAEHGRIAELAAGGAVNRKLVDETLDQLRAAEATRAEAGAKVESSQAILAESKAGIEKAKADQAVARARLQSAQADLARARTLRQ